MDDYADLDDYKLPDHEITVEGWRHIWYDSDLGHAELSTVPKDVETFVHYDNGENKVALLIQADTGEIVGIHLEDVDFKYLRP